VREEACEGRAHEGRDVQRKRHMRKEKGKGRV